jgi:hypothetical protein
MAATRDQELFGLAMLPLVRLHPARNVRATQIFPTNCEKGGINFLDHSGREAVFESLSSYVDSVGGLRKFKELRRRGAIPFSLRTAGLRKFKDLRRRSADRIKSGHYEPLAQCRSQLFNDSRRSSRQRVPTCKTRTTPHRTNLRAASSRVFSRPILPNRPRPRPTAPPASISSALARGSGMRKILHPR